MKVRVTRTVFHSDGNNCADRDVFKGEEFYLFTGLTFESISDRGVALANSEDRFDWFFEFPKDAIEAVDEQCDSVEPEVPA